MKKVLSVLILVTLFTAFIPLKANAASDEGYFIVTAYYSPLPDQEYYITGDYEDEKRLNGQGIKGASGEPVFSGMLAAPKNYKFGTKIYLEGFGIGVVEDRGGAIVNAGQRGYGYDRIDIWVGYGDEGLRRAMYWGKKKVKGYIVDSNSKASLNYNDIPAPLWATKNLKKLPSIFNESIGIKSNKATIIKLQQFLKKIGMYNGKPNGVYNKEVIDVIYNFQIENKIIDSEGHSGAGYWGNLTRKTVLKKYLDGEFNKKVVTKPVSESSAINMIESVEVSVEETEENNFDKRINKVRRVLDIFDEPLAGMENVKKVQAILTRIGYYDGIIDGSHERLKEVLLTYQLEKNIIADENVIGAGRFGPKTREQMRSDFEIIVNVVVKKIEEEKRKFELEEKFKQLEIDANMKAEDKISKIGTPKFGQVSPQVRELQKVLGLLGYFTHRDTAFFGDVTKQSIISYQLEKGIISSVTSIGAGLFGPSTKENLTKDLGKHFFESVLKEEGIEEEFATLEELNEA